MGQKRILIICDDPTLNTGYARVGRFVAQSLHQAEYHVRYLPCNSFIPDSERKFDFELDTFNPQDRYWSHNIGNVLTNYKPSLVMVLGEFAFVGFLGNVCRQYGIRSLYYCPVEGDHYPPAIVYTGGGHIDFKLTLMKFNYIVAYSEFGARNINALLPGIVTDVIPHQVDTRVFRPLDRRACLSTFFPNFVNDPGIGVDKLFIVGHIGRNQRRKGTDYLLQGYASFVNRYVTEDGRKPLLFLTTDPQDSHGYNLFDLVQRYGLGGRVSITPVIGGKNGPQDHHLTEIINTFDLAVYPHRAEGFGLPVLETLACGVRVVTTDYASPAEFGKDVCTLVKPINMEPLEGTNCEWAVLDSKDVGDAIAKVYLQQDTKEPYEPGVALAQRFDCLAVAARWVKLLKELQLPDMPEMEQQQAPATDSVIQDYLSTVE